jgi:hypothetical protein
VSRATTDPATGEVYLTLEDVAAIDEARADLALGDLTPWDHVRHELRHSA